MKDVPKGPKTMGPIDYFDSRLREEECEYFTGTRRASGWMERSGAGTGFGRVAAKNLHSSSSLAFCPNTLFGRKQKQELMMPVDPDSDVAKWYECAKTSNNFERWMEDLPDSLKLLPITHLAIPGTHDSMSCGISRSSEISPDSTRTVKALAKVLGPVVRSIVFKWCVTQHSMVKEQLVAGIRYFDLRIAVHKPSGKLQFVHGLYAKEIVQPLTDIKNFLVSHKQEVVILDIQHFYNFSAHSHARLQNLLHDHFGSMMCPLPESGNVSRTTLNWMIEHKFQVILIYRSSCGHGDPQLWPSKCWPTPWPQTTSVHNMISFLENGLAKRPANAGYVSQCVLTPNTWFVVLHPRSNLLSRCAAPCNYTIISWLEQQSPGECGVNVIITDFFDFDSTKFPYVKTIVLLNRKFVLGDQNESNSNEKLNVH